MKFKIVEIKQLSGEKAKIYSVLVEGDENSLLEQFFEENVGYTNDLKWMATNLATMGHSYGCRISFFKENEGAPGDGVVAYRRNKLRLYCLRFDSACIFCGSGGVKTTRTYQDDPILNSKVQQIKKIAASINKAIKEGDLTIHDDGTYETTQFLDLHYE